MGCTASNPDDGGGGGGGGGRVFEVANIDDSGQERSCGKLEVTTSDLVLYYPGARDAVRWPFPSLRRYGFNDHLFSFESGRRCPSGHGIYAFRCSRAEQLFRQLQESIAMAGQERRSRSLVAETGSTEVQTRNPGVDPQTADQTNPHLDRIDPRFTDYINEANFTESWRRYVNHQTTTSDPREVSAMTPVQCQPIGTMNRQSTSSSCHDRRPSFPSTARDNVIQYAQLDLPMELVDYDEEAEVFQTPEVGSVAGHFRSPPTYVNVPLTAMKAREQRPLVAALTYAQLDLGEVDASAAAADRGSGSSYCAEAAMAATATAAAAAAAATVPRRSGGKCEFPSSREKPEIYARIDFRRTIALSTRTTSETEDEGFRKTRHNSNIETLTRN